MNINIFPKKKQKHTMKIEKENPYQLKCTYECNKFVCKYVSKEHVLVVLKLSLLALQFRQNF